MVAFPVLLLIIFGVVQGALHYYARSVAAGAASEAVIAGSVVNGSAATASAAANTFIASAGGALLADSSVTISRGATLISATVTGHAINVLPGIPTPAISQTVTGAIERTTES